MATQPIVPQHDFHAEAHALSGNLQLPVRQPIYKQAAVTLTGYDGGHFFQRTEKYSLEGVISFDAGYTHVSGSPSEKKGHGWITLATSVLEGLNVLDVITADRVVAQASTEHAIEKGYIPSVRFLGTRFENLRIGGYEAIVELDLEFCGPIPSNGSSYLGDPSFRERVLSQARKMRDAAGLPKDAQAQYDKELSNIAEVEKRCNPGNKTVDGDQSVHCTLVKSITPIPGVEIFGNILKIPDFGLVSLANLEAGIKRITDPGSSRPESHYFGLNMLGMQMGCIAEGTAAGANVLTNGHNKP